MILIEQDANIRIAGQQQSVLIDEGATAVALKEGRKRNIYLAMYTYI